MNNIFTKIFDSEMVIVHSKFSKFRAIQAKHLTIANRF